MMSVSPLRLLLFLLFLAGGSCHAAATILVFGDSLSAGYGIRQDAAWPALLARRLAEKRLDYSVVNASISGETTAGGRSRIADALAKHRPAVLILALGANDGLRGLPVAAMKENLVAMIRSAHGTQSVKGAKTRVLLVGMRLPPNYGPYADAFEQAFRDVARSEKVAFAPFLLDGIADQPQRFQADTIHPTAEAQPRLLDNVWAHLAPLLK